MSNLSAAFTDLSPGTTIYPTAGGPAMTVVRHFRDLVTTEGVEKKLWKRGDVTTVDPCGEREPVALKNEGFAPWESAKSTPAADIREMGERVLEETGGLVKSKAPPPVHFRAHERPFVPACTAELHPSMESTSRLHEVTCEDCLRAMKAPLPTKPEPTARYKGYAITLKTIGAVLPDGPTAIDRLRSSPAARRSIIVNACLQAIRQFPDRTADLLVECVEMLEKSNEALVADLIAAHRKLPPSPFIYPPVE